MHPRSNHQVLVGPGQVDHHIADMTATFAADVTLGQAQSVLAGHQQWLAIDGDPDTQLGQLVLRNSTGPLRCGYGAWRDLLLGAQFTDKTGRLLTVGGRTVKNVAGYDLTKFLIGSLGFIGDPVTLTTRTYRQPEAAIHASFNAEPGLASKLLPTSLKPTWMLESADQTFVGYLIDAADAWFYEQELPAHKPISIARASHEDDIQLRTRLWSSRKRLRVSVAPASAVTFCQRANLADYCIDPVHGVIVSNDNINPQQIAELARSMHAIATCFDDHGNVTGHMLNPDEQRLASVLIGSFGSQEDLKLI